MGIVPYELPSVADPMIDYATTSFAINHAQFPEAIGSLCMIVGPMHGRGSGTEDKWPERKWLGRKGVRAFACKAKDRKFDFLSKVRLNYRIQSV